MKKYLPLFIQVLLCLATGWLIGWGMRCEHQNKDSGVHLTYNIHDSPLEKFCSCHIDYRLKAELFFGEPVHRIVVHDVRSVTAFPGCNDATKFDHVNEWRDAMDFAAPFCFSEADGRGKCTVFVLSKRTKWPTVWPELEMNAMKEPSEHMSSEDYDNIDLRGGDRVRWHCDWNED